jgi:hypothetical protein
VEQRAEVLLIRQLEGRVVKPQGGRRRGVSASDVSPPLHPRPPLRKRGSSLRAR